MKFKFIDKNTISVMFMIFITLKKLIKSHQNLYTNHGEIE